MNRICIFSFLKLCYTQLIFNCNSHKDCYVNSYCNKKNICESCDNITPNYCNGIKNDCCSNDFLKQCQESTYTCITNDTNNNTIYKINGVNFFLYFFFISSFFYLSYGIYFNKYVKNNKGIDIIPNINFWLNLYSLVKDGIYFTKNKIIRI